DAMSAALGESRAIDVVEPAGEFDLLEEFENRIITEGAFTEYGTLVNSGEYDGLDFKGAFAALAARFEKDGTGARRVSFRLRDWGLSRLRYCGRPIPVIYALDVKARPVTDDQWPLVLPEDESLTGIKT